MMRSAAGAANIVRSSAEAARSIGRLRPALRGAGYLVGVIPHVCEMSRFAVVENLVVDLEYCRQGIRESEGRCCEITQSPVHSRPERLLPDRMARNPLRLARCKTRGGRSWRRSVRKQRTDRAGHSFFVFGFWDFGCRSAPRCVGALVHASRGAL